MNNQAWIPTAEIIKNANISKVMKEYGFNDVKSFHHWTVAHYEDFWQRVVELLDIRFKHPFHAVCDLTQGIESPRWFPGSKLNIIDSCFKAEPNKTAIYYLDSDHTIQLLSYRELDQLSNRIANSLIEQGFKKADPMAIIMPMNVNAVALYLGIIKMGGIVISIADSFSSQEMATRLNIANAKAVFTQNYTVWAGKKIPLYEKVSSAQKIFSTLNNNSLTIFILKNNPKEEAPILINEKDIHWHHFLSANDQFSTIPCDPMSTGNILFSSGTTAAPKAIPWNHTTPIKAASDAFFHQNIQSDDILAWPTNLGWMMGPWLIFAALINNAAIALYTDTPMDASFGEFIQNAKVTMLGVVPTLVSAWHATRCMENFDWHAVKRFSSTGECSKPEDMQYLATFSGHKPIIEYCGGTEIGGAYISSTVIEKNYPSLFSTPTMGLDFIMLDEQGKPANIGEVALIPPSIGLSTFLLNADHHKVYFADMPALADGTPLRRHGDAIEKLDNSYYMLLGRIDDAMNLSGIKVSSAEIERALTGLEDIKEVAAVASSATQNGPEQLIIFATTDKTLEKNMIMQKMQQKINSQLNPLFKIHDIIFLESLPKTASNKIMRRLLRQHYQEKYLNNIKNTE